MLKVSIDMSFFIGRSKNGTISPLTSSARLATAATSFTFSFKNGVYLVLAKEHLPNVNGVHQRREDIVPVQFAT
ncbi:hypothetical protein D9M72_617840 [compost metagenome]